MSQSVSDMHDMMVGLMIAVGVVSASAIGALIIGGSFYLVAKFFLFLKTGRQ